MAIYPFRCLYLNLHNLRMATSVGCNPNLRCLKTILYCGDNSHDFWFRSPYVWLVSPMLVQHAKTLLLKSYPFLLGYLRLSTCLCRPWPSSHQCALKQPELTDLCLPHHHCLNCRNSSDLGQVMGEVPRQGQPVNPRKRGLWPATMCEFRSW